MSCVTLHFGFAQVLHVQRKNAVQLGGIDPPGTRRILLSRYFTRFDRARDSGGVLSSSFGRLTSSVFHALALLCISLLRKSDIDFSYRNWFNAQTAPDLVSGLSGLATKILEQPLNVWCVTRNFAIC